MTGSTGPDGVLTIALAGSVGSSATNEINRAVEEGIQSHRRILLDLSEVTLIDRGAVHVIAEILHRGAELMDCPSYLKHWIERGNNVEPET